MQSLCTPHCAAAVMRDCVMCCVRAKLTQERAAHMEAKHDSGQQAREKVEQFLESEREKELLKEAVSPEGGGVRSSE